MPARSDVIFDRGLDVFGSVVENVPPEAWDNPSPCAGWSARDVLGHVGSATEMGISILEGQQPVCPDAAQPGDLVDGDPAAWWADRARRVRAALSGADLESVRDTPMGPRTVEQGIAFPAIDLYVHGWDIARATGADFEIPADVIEFAHSYIDPMPNEMMRGEHGAFGAEVSAPADATPTEEFLAWTGRDPRAALA